MQSTPFGIARAISIGSALLAIVTANSAAWAVTPVDTCGQVLDIARERYVLVTDLSCVSPSEPAISVTADHVTFDLQGHTIAEAEGSVIHYGIQGTGITHLTILDGTVTGFQYGIWLEGVSNARVHAVTLTENMVGVTLTGSNRSTVDDSSIHDNIRGVVLTDSTLNRITGNTLTHNIASNVSFPNGGISMSNADQNMIANNVLRLNGVFGITLGDGSDSNRITGNLIEDTKDGGLNLHPGLIVHEGTDNLIWGNTSTGNEYGIRLASGAVSNTVFMNITRSNEIGIQANVGATGNEINRNTSQSNTLWDLADLNATCDSNHWYMNVFATDNESGLGAGPGTGCIQ